MPEPLSLYGTIGTGYNLKRNADSYLAERLLFLLHPSVNGMYLDIGCGTENYTDFLSRSGYHFYGIDPSMNMLEKARSKNNTVTWIQASADAIPVADSFFTGAVATLTIHHWQDLEKSFREINRVLQPDTRFVLFTSTPEQMHGYWLNHYFPAMMKASAEKMPSFATVSNAAEKAGFTITETEKYFVKPDLQDLFLYSGKHDPERYFDPAIRNGISSFSLFSTPEQTETGLSQLRRDVDNGSFYKIKERYENTDGDYLFILMKCSSASRRMPWTPSPDGTK